MGFSNKWVWALANVLLWGGTTTAQEEGTQIRVLVNDSVSLEPSVLKQAEREASRVFQEAGIGIQWINCAETDECRHVIGRKEFVLHIVATGSTMSDFVYGEAFLGADGRGQYSDVFFDRIRSAQEDIDVARLLGAVAAHELGHLLLGLHAHSHIGIMEPVWEKGSVKKIGMGTLLFTPGQSRLMRNRIADQSSVARLTPAAPAW